MMVCIKCLQPMLSVPVYNNNDDFFPASFLFCNNKDCVNFGLLAITFKNITDNAVDVKEEDKIREGWHGFPA